IEALIRNQPAKQESRPKRVLMVSQSYHPIIGGAERQAKLLAETLFASGHSVTVLTGQWLRGFSGFEAINGVQVRRLFTFYLFFEIPLLKKFTQVVFLF